MTEDAKSTCCAFHGTDAENLESIQKTGFKESNSSDEWLGRGVYFFVDGIACPVKSAVEWGKNQAWTRSGLKYSEYGVIKAEISTGNILDLRNEEDHRIFNELRDKTISKYESHFVRNREFREDGFIIDAISSLLKLEAIIANLYIKTKVQRIKNIRSAIPNVTAMCVKSESCIAANTLQVVERGRTDE